MTDDQLMMTARAAGYAMIPPQDASETELETVVVEQTVELSETASAYFAKMKSWLPAAPSVSTWLHSRAPA
jgi:hypothetical protein